MTNVFEEKPGIVKVVLSDSSGTAERFIVGKSLDEVLAVVGTSFNGGSAITLQKKPRRKRRTKAEIEQAKEPETARDAPEPEPTPTKEKKEKAWA